MDLLSALGSGSSVIAAELRPPRAELATREGMDAWIDTYHAVRRLTRQGTFVMLTDSAVGAEEEDNLRHLVINLGNDVPRERIVLGGWANPHADPERQVDFIASAEFHAEFFLTQIVSHHHVDRVSRFID